MQQIMTTVNAFERNRERDRHLDLLKNVQPYIRFLGTTPVR